MIKHESIEFQYISTTDIEHRKKYAQFFTPKPIAEIMSEWLVCNNQLHTVLEPAFGLGIFSRCLLKKNNNIQIKGFEIDKHIFSKAKKLFSETNNVEVLLQDYMYNDWENKYDGIICNPPYFKFHDYDNKNIIHEIETRLSCNLNGFTNLYTLFLLKSIYQLNPNGRCAYIVPSEFLNSDYGTLVKKELIKTKTLRHIIVFNFRENIFSDALTTVCLILCAKDYFSDNIHFTHIGNINEINKIYESIHNYPDYNISDNILNVNELNAEIKWKNYYQKSIKDSFNHLVPFSNYAKVMRGIATGANDYFTFNISKANQYKINEKYLLPCICKSIDVKSIFFSETDFNKLKDNDKKVYLLNAIGSKDENISRYIRMGEDEGINKRYLTSSRNPWFSLENRTPAPIWVSVFNRTGLKFIRNIAGISNLTTFHCIYPLNNLFSDISINVLFGYLQTETAISIFKDNCREYGNGLQKFEPNDLNKGLILDLSLLTINEKKEINRLCDDKSRFIDIDKINDILKNKFAK